MEEEKSGITLGGIYRTIMSCKWLALIIAVVITVAGTLVLKFAYNPLKTEYVSNFSITFPGSGELNPVYPDNKPFNYRSIISKENLESIKASDKQFENIKVLEMYMQSDISIERNVYQITEEKTDIEYKIRVKAKYFKDEITAMRFIDRVANIPIDYIKGLAISKDAYLKEFNNQSDYELKIATLQAQLGFIKGRIDGLSGKIKDNEYDTFISKVNAYNDKLNGVIGILRSGLFVAEGNSTVESYRTQLVSLKALRDEKLEELKLIFGKFDETPSDIISNGESSSSAAVRSLASEISSLNNKISVYELYTAENAAVKPATEDFKNGLNEVFSELVVLTDDYERILCEYYSSVSLIAYGGAVFNVEIGIGTVKSFLLSFVAGLMLAIITAYIAGNIKLKKAAVKVDVAEVDDGEKVEKD